MLDFQNFQNLAELKKRFAKAFGVIDFEFTDNQLQNIFEEIEKIPASQRNLTAWQSVVTFKTGYRTFRMNEALEFSDINHIHKQIQDILNKK